VEPVLEIENITREFRSDLAGRRLYSLGPINVEVVKGEIFGYLGPNGAGKTTTIKMIMGLLKPTSGRILCFRAPSRSSAARARIGFLPEQPYFYQHLTARELLEFCGGLFGLEGPVLKARANDLIRLVGLEGHGETRISKFSKGMLQRVGLAQALVNNPDLVILDEPLSGLDPVGRREIRDLIVRLKSEGRTVFFSSHILQDVEMICDRVAILAGGKIQRTAAVSEVLNGSLISYEIRVARLSPDAAAGLGLGRLSAKGDATVVTLPPEADLNDGLRKLMAAGARVESVQPLRQTLEDYFLRELRRPVSGPGRTEKSEQPSLAAMRGEHRP
jgi:ABC-2 type transport system ATP-binding protein